MCIIMYPILSKPFGFPAFIVVPSWTIQFCIYHASRQAHPQLNTSVSGERKFCKPIGVQSFELPPRFRGFWEVASRWPHINFVRVAAERCAETCQEGRIGKHRRSIRVVCKPIPPAASPYRCMVVGGFNNMFVALRNRIPCMGPGPGPRLANR